MTEANRASTVALPVPRQVVAAGDEDVDAVVRAARAHVARLSLELRSLRHEAELAQPTADDPGAGGEVLDIPAARQFLHAGLENRLSSRRREMRIELDEARTAAALRIRDAQDESARLVGVAREELMAALVSATGRPDGVARSGVRASQRQMAEPTAGRIALEPATPSPWAPIADGVVAPTEARVALPLAPPATPTLVLPAPVVAPAPAPASSMPPPAAPAPSPAPTPHVPAPRAPAPGRRKPSLRAKFLHADVMLPLIAVVIVLVVLVAWLA